MAQPEPRPFQFKAKNSDNILMGQRKLKLREDVLSETSNKQGLAGYFETFMRRFRTASFLLMISPLMLICCFCVGLAAAPAIFLFRNVAHWSADWPGPLPHIALGIGFAASFITYGMSLIFIVPAVNFFMPRVRPFRGPWYSLQAIPWYIHNGLTYMARYTFLDFITPTPINLLFYRMMGMKMGKGCVINTSNISDPCMITLGDYVTVGGSAHLLAHYGQKGYLVIAPVTIGTGTNIGLKASIMGGVTIGEFATVKPHSAVLPKTDIPPGSTV